MFQFLELIFFALLAFTLISKLISILGTTNDGDNDRYKSFFGEPRVKDVTTSDTDREIKVSEVLVNRHELQDYIVLNNVTNIIENVNELQKEVKNFSIQKFIRGAKGAFELILNSFHEPDKLAALVDPRYIEKFQALESNYVNIKDCNEIRAKIADIYRFGKNVFIKVLFYKEDQNDFYEEWTFSKSLLVNNQYWFLTNVEKIYTKFGRS